MKEGTPIFQVGELALSRQLICMHDAVGKCQGRDLNLVQPSLKVYVLSIVPYYLKTQMCHKFRRKQD